MIVPPLLAGTSFEVPHCIVKKIGKEIMSGTAVKPGNFTKFNYPYLSSNDGESLQLILKVDKSLNKK